MSYIEDQTLKKSKVGSVTHPSFDTVPSSEIHAYLNANATMITSNQRLSRFRLQTYEEKQIQSGKQAWSTPQVLPWSAWLRQQWNTSNQGVWLSSHQESLLWRACIAEDEATQVLNAKALAKQAMEACKIMSDFNIDDTCLTYAGEEHIALLRWKKEVQNKTKHVLNHHVLSMLTQDMAEQQPHTLLLDGFDSFTPAQVNYFKHLKKNGYLIFEIINDRTPANTTLHLYQDEEHEVRQVCQKVKRIINTHSLASIGILIPDLERRAPTINRIFSEELAPHLSLTTNTDIQGDYFNISLGQSLAKQPMIQGVLSLLNLTINPYITYDKVTQLLLNPYISGSKNEQVQRAALDAWLRNNNQAQLTLQQLLKQCQSSDIEIPEFIQFISFIIQHSHEKKSFSGKQTLSKWILLIEEILAQLDWHEQALEHHSHEIAQVQNWRDLMTQLTTLDDFCGSISWSDALFRVQELAHEQLFRPAPGTANVQVMGLLEAANIQFDYAFVLGMDNITWPQAAKPHALIPFDIQVLHQTPHANSEREWLYAQSVWQHTQHLSPTLEVSYAKSKEKQDVQASPLLEGFIANVEDDIPSQRYVLTLQQYAEKLTEIQDPAQAIDTQEEVRGGTGIIKAQAVCAFQAFARYRLHLQGLQTPSTGLSPAEQGTLLHATLEHFWRNTKTSDNLILHIKNQMLEQHISTAISTAWSCIHRFITSELKSLESQRLQGLIQQWLMLESKRDSFVVTHSEAWKNVKLGKTSILLLHTKLDRIDKTASGKHIVLDYKTGETSTGKAMGYRLDEPQLAIYYLAEKATGTEPHALAFAQVRSGDMAFKGFAQEADALLGVRTFKGRKDQPQDWGELTSSWQETLHRLADEFMAGEANVAPKSIQSCTYCEFDGLCRIKI